MKNSPQVSQFIKDVRARVNAANRTSDLAQSFGQERMTPQAWMSRARILLGDDVVSREVAIGAAAAICLAIEAAETPDAGDAT